MAETAPQAFDLRGIEIAAPPGVDRLFAGSVLNGPILDAIVQLKYRRQRCLAEPLGRGVAHLAPRAADGVCFVPTAAVRRRRRGYDHAAELARSVARHSEVPLCSALRRLDHSQQTARSPQQRRIGPTLVAVRPVPGLLILVDDVVTTGSSLSAAALALRRAGARRVIGVSIAVSESTASTASTMVRPWKSPSVHVAPR